MGMLVDGKWQQEMVRATPDGKFLRKDAQLRNWITADGTPGPSGEGGFDAQPNRYHLYVSLACPWAHRTLIYRIEKGLADMIGVSVVHPFMHTDGWAFEPGPGVIPDEINGASCMHEIYTRADPGYTGRASVPVLWDKQKQTIVSNESAEIIRMLNSAFDKVGAKPVDFYPDPLQSEIDELNDFIYSNVNDGVYRAGFAKTQEHYETAVRNLFNALDELEKRLGGKRYLLGDTITEADWRLLPTLLRFDPVYVGHFKCNLKRLIDYPALWAYTCDLYQHPGVAETVDISHYKQHYYGSHESVNPTRIVPLGPEFDYSQPHGREHM
jgi:putative glutathione S-transferase